ncbi:MAG: tyrosine-protein phosphatase [Dehalococcoidia bacterium]|nr:tyrosine-protein phosphatase [Dehalococcoidia bacterium]
MERHLEFDGVINFRDIGGYRTSGGDSVRWRKLFRSGSLHYMTDADVQHAHDLGVQSVLDLRRPSEIAHQGLGPLTTSPSAGSVVTLHALPVIPDEASPQLDEKYGRGISGARYRGYLEFGGSEIDGTDYPSYFVTALELLAQESTYPALFHCSAGKDRTGVLAAFVLDILGVDDETISDDYVLSNLAADGLIAQTRRDVERRRAAGEAIEGAPSNSPPAGWLPVPLDGISVFMAAVREDFGSARGYFEAHGVKAATFDRLAEALLE